MAFQEVTDMFMVVDLDPRVFPNRRKVFLHAQIVEIKDNQIRIVSSSGEVSVFALSDWRVHVGMEACEYIF